MSQIPTENKILKHMELLYLKNNVDNSIAKRELRDLLSVKYKTNSKLLKQNKGYQIAWIKFKEKLERGCNVDKNTCTEWHADSCGKKKTTSIEYNLKLAYLKKILRKANLAT